MRNTIRRAAHACWKRSTTFAAGSQLSSRRSGIAFRTASATSFAGGYAAGYYSYKWAEVLAADAFAAFEESGVFNDQTAQRFLDSILSRGGSRDPLEAFIEFRGRKPDIAPLLRQHGMAS